MVNSELLCSLLAPLAGYCLLPAAFEGSSWCEAPLVPPSYDNMSP